MNLTITMGKEDLEAAVKEHLKSQGLEVSGPITFRIDHGDQREPGAGATASMSVRTINRGGSPAYDR